MPHTSRRTREAPFEAVNRIAKMRYLVLGSLGLMRQLLNQAYSVEPYPNIIVLFRSIPSFAK